MFFIVFVLKSGQTTITVTCALKNQYENLPDWLGKYVGMIVKVKVFIFFDVRGFWSLVSGDDFNTTSPQNPNTMRTFFFCPGSLPQALEDLDSFNFN